MNNELVSIDEWFRTNKLSLNMDKTNYILFRTRHKASYCDNILNINGYPIRCVSSIKFLGVIIDEHLDWSKHISFIESKISKNIGVIYKISGIVDKKILKLLYYSLIYPYFTYCNIVWAANYPTRLRGLHILQKKAVRIIFHLPYRAPTGPTFLVNDLLNIHQLNKFQICLFMFKYNSGELPNVFIHMFKKTSEIHTFALRSSINYRSDFCGTTFKSFSICCRGPRLYNSLPVHLKSIKSITLFKKCLKSFILLSN